MRPEEAGPAGNAPWSRRRALKVLSVVGVTSAVFARALEALASEGGRVTARMIRRAEWISGIRLDDEKRKLMLDGLGRTLESYRALRAVPVDNSVPPAIRFDPALPTDSPARPAGGRPPARSGSASSSSIDPSSEEDVAFATVAELGSLLRAGRLSSVDLTELSLRRLRRHDPLLSCVVTLTEDLALEQARRADRELASGRDRGPLHGIPWGAKDLLAVPGYPTTWGAKPYRDQVRPEKAAVVGRLEEAGAVLVAKLTLGALAWGDVWFGGKTKNPWKTDQGSSGSSAGSASATSAGLVPFAIGSETWGSIVSPCTRCGVTGLRPTFGRVSRFGAMALAWSMDKIGPIARSAEDCASVFSAIQGADGRDRTVTDRAFGWPPDFDYRDLRVGFVEDLFEEDRTLEAHSEEEKPALAEWQAHDRQTLEVLRGLGVRLIPVKLPERLPVRPLSFILTAEAAAAFDDLTRTGRDDLLVRQIEQAWPNVFRQGQLIPAVEYLRANRVRTMVMEEMARLMSDLDAYVAPSYGGDNLLLTNLTGHPAVVVPNGFRSADGTPTSITFTGGLHGEEGILALADAYQKATGFHRRRPLLALPDERSG